MKYLLILLLGAFAFVGCEKKEEAPVATPPAADAPATTNAPATP